MIMLVFAQIVNVFFQIYTFTLLARILGSWFPEIFRYRIMQFVVFITDPYLNLFRRFIPPLGMIDISPIFAFLCLGFIQSFIVNTILRWA
jgi:YggT family protein